MKIEQLGQMLMELEEQRAKIGFKINLSKTNVMCKEEHQITTKNQITNDVGEKTAELN